MKLCMLTTSWVLGTQIHPNEQPLQRPVHIFGLSAHAYLMIGTKNVGPMSVSRKVLGWLGLLRELTAV